MTRFITPTLVLTAILMLTEASPSIGQSSASLLGSTSKLPFKSKVIISGTGASSNLVAADRARVDHIKSQAGNKDAFDHNHVHARAKHTFGITNIGVKCV
jgi:RNase P/RNase MRP subunit p30